MKKIKRFIIISMSSIIMLIGMLIDVSASDKNELDIMKDYFSTNLIEIKKAYYTQFNDNLKANKVICMKYVYDLNDNINGYISIFDIGYVSFGLDMEFYCMSNASYDSRLIDEKIYSASKSLLLKQNGKFYDLEGNEFSLEAKGKSVFQSEIVYSLTSVYQNEDFEITNCCTKIPELKYKFDSSKWGNYKIASCEQGDTTDCGVIAIMNLIYSYKLSGVADFSKNKDPFDMRMELRTLTNWQGNIAGEGMLPFDMCRGCNDYINDSRYSLYGPDYDEDMFGICFYHNANIAETAHFALKVGTAQQKYWWFFKTYWDIVVNWKKNINSYCVPNSIDESVVECYYVIDQQYRRAQYQLRDNYDNVLR